MRLPQVSYADGIKTAKQDEFAGLNHNLGAKDGELWDMRNLCSDYSPLLATRSRRMLYKTLQDPGGLFCWDKLCWVDGTTFYYDGVAKGTVTASRKTFTALGAYIVIFPDKAYYNTAADEFGNLEATWTGASLTFTNGKLYEEDAEANCIQAEGVNWEDYFKAGDAVTIAGCTKHTENNKTPVIREIDGDNAVLLRIHLHPGWRGRCDALHRNRGAFGLPDSAGPAVRLREREPPVGLRQDHHLRLQAGGHLQLECVRGTGDGQLFRRHRQRRQLHGMYLLSGVSHLLQGGPHLQGVRLHPNQF